MIKRNGVEVMNERTKNVSIVKKNQLELLELLREEVAQPESFGPFLGFRYALMFTRLLAGLGQMKAAAKWADRALSAQRAEISGLRHYKPVGWASGIDEGTEIWLRELAARGKE